jgi:hypothetical protein
MIIVFWNNIFFSSETSEQHLSRSILGTWNSCLLFGVSLIQAWCVVNQGFLLCMLFMSPSLTLPKRCSLDMSSLMASKASDVHPYIPHLSNRPWIEPVEYSRTGQMPYTGGNEPYGLWSSSSILSGDVRKWSKPHRKCETGQLILIKIWNGNDCTDAADDVPLSTLARLPYSHDGWKTRSEHSSHTHATRQAIITSR